MSPFSEEEEVELAAELLDVGSEAELDQFLGKFFKRVRRRVRKVGRRIPRGLARRCPAAASRGRPKSELKRLSEMLENLFAPEGHGPPKVGK